MPLSADAPASEPDIIGSLFTPRTVVRNQRESFVDIDASHDDQRPVADGPEVPRGDMVILDDAQAGALDANALS